MKNIIFYSYSKCSTCRKAANWLDMKDLEYQLIDIVKEPPKLDYLNQALEQYSEDIKRIFNTRGKSFKSINPNIYSLSKEEIIKLLLSDGKLIKRPFLIYEEKVILGFNEIEYAKQFM
ncbi:MAG: Spx/MgsR family RNA polymerase-binding regulatory protein [Prochlorococcus marinus CUG1431]|uniref:Spx/MgsR family RNA polymerase-binding regulatory protein n=1 Tax=Prochlorococcus marinus CUG1433 TaxID=2774506 RepID=A0A9D9G4U8_PROMR|nr:Spx/MgsR family RNA polymerase-binding regulatory protein [Prochlorococcus marinus CUG1433]MBO6980535.1 Spx/MgsR family RNA polymerase-binding regulatory protein [Prochlorococcus marinus CUG1431]